MRDGFTEESRRYTAKLRLPPDITSCTRHPVAILSARLLLTARNTSAALPPPPGSVETTAAFTSMPSTSAGERGRGCAWSDSSSTNDRRGPDVSRGEGSGRRRDLQWLHASRTRGFENKTAQSKMTYFHPM